MVPVHSIHPQPTEGTPGDHDKVLVVLESEESEEESSEDQQQPVTPWDDLCIIDRVGLNSALMTEDQLEWAFSQIALAFRCDQFTLKQRLLAEEHARNLAEENIQLELVRGRETLEALKALCLDNKRSQILQRLELCLDIMEGTVERVSSTAEVLGAVHQEARVSRALDLMVSHVENMRRRLEKGSAVLDETKDIHGRGSSRVHSDCKGEGDFKERFGKSSQQLHFGASRRRVSIELITKQTQEKRKRERVLHKSLSLDNVMGRKTSPSAPSSSLFSITESSEPSSSLFSITESSEQSSSLFSITESSEPSSSLFSITESSEPSSSLFSITESSEQSSLTALLTESKPCVTVETSSVLDYRPPETPDDSKAEVTTSAVRSGPQPGRSLADTAIPRSAPTRQPNQVVAKQANSRSFPLETLLRHRNRGKAALEKTDRRHVDQEKTTRTPSGKRSAGLCGRVCRGQPLAHKLWHRHRLDLVVVLCCVLLLIVLLWVGPELL